MGDPAPERQGVTCTFPDTAVEREYILHRTYDPGGGPILSLTYGVADPAVAVIAFELSNGDRNEVETIVAPSESDLPVRFWVTPLSATENGRVLAYDVDGNLLEEKKLCEQTCLRGARP